jgi:hypothetical protein
MKNNEELEKMFALTDKLLAPYYNGIAEGEKRQLDRIMKILNEMQETALATGNPRGRHTASVVENAKVLIKGENK